MKILHNLELEEQEVLILNQRVNKLEFILQFIMITIIAEAMIMGMR